ncbi:MAG TPA: NAD(P)H-binding protein [Opitutaceae bacterium]
MKIVVIGGSGLIGKKVVARLSQRGHEAVPASPSQGVNSVTGEGLAGVLKGADVIIDVSNSPSFADAPVLEFFERSTRNLIAAGRAAGVRHYVALSIAGVHRLPESGYFRAKVAQEALIEKSGIPFTIVQATQFMEFLGPIAQSCLVRDTYRVPDALLQLIASDDVADAVTDAAIGQPRNGRIETGGPDKHTFADAVQRRLWADGDTRPVVVDASASYFGVPLQRDTLTAGNGARLGAIRLDDWLARSVLPQVRP